jgi:hypothetical protein
VNKAPTALSATPAIVGLDQTFANLSLTSLHLYLFTLTATLSSPVTGKGVAGQPVTFTSGSTIDCTATTNASGVASCNALANAIPIALANGYSVSYPGTSNYIGSRSTAGLFTIHTLIAPIF